MKLSDLDGAKRQKLNQAPVHNLSEERSVGLFNYEIQIRGQKHMESVSRKMVINESIDLLTSRPAKDIHKFSKPTRKIKEIKMEWQQKVREQQKLGFSKKETENLNSESTKYTLLEELKKEAIPGPFYHITGSSQLLCT